MLMLMLMLTSGTVSFTLRNELIIPVCTISPPLLIAMVAPVNEKLIESYKGYMYTYADLKYKGATYISR